MAVETLLHVSESETGKNEIPIPVPRAWNEGNQKISGDLLPIQTYGGGRDTSFETLPKPAQATPTLLYIGTLTDDRLRLRIPIEVEIEREAVFYIAKCQYVDEFGYGESPMKAVDDLQAALAELYWALKEDEKRLGRNLAETWEWLRKVVEER
ncbi:MAG: hypothetical protein IMY77_00110 [Chloroflexi bacterium]|nr:hypothetical protein [Chloroflexota bacterium]